MYKSLPVFLLGLLSAFVVPGQTPSDGSTESLLLRIQNSRADTSRVEFYLQLGSTYLNKLNPVKKDLDSAATFFNEALQLSDTLRDVNRQMKTLLLLGSCYFRKGDNPRGRASFIQVITYYQRTKDKEREASAWSDFGLSSPLAPPENIPDKIQRFEQARSLYHQLHLPAEEITALRNIAEAHLNQGKIDLAEKELNLVLDQYKSIGYKKLHYTYNLLAEVSRQKLDTKQELFYRLEQIKSIEATADTNKNDYFYSKLALVYSDLGMYDESLQWIRRSMQILKRKIRKGDYYGYLSLLVYNLISAGRPAEALSALKETARDVPPSNLAQQVDLYEGFGNCYKAMKQYHQAEEYYLLMLQTYETTSFNKDFYTTDNQMATDYVHYYETMSEFYILTQQYQKAGFYLNRILSLPEGFTSPINLSKFHLMQFVVDSASGNYISAIRHLQLHKKLNDSLYNANKSKQIAELSIHYQTSQKEKSILLLEAQGKTQQAELQKANWQRNITFGGGSMLLIIAGLAYKGYRDKQRNNKELQVKQSVINHKNESLQRLLNDKDNLLVEKDWLLKEVHHRVKNNLQIIISLLNAQTDFLDNPAALNAIRESRERMQAIALIHQKLYQPGHSTQIQMHSYIHELVSYLGSGFADVGRIRFQLDIADINLDVSQAVPLGLILNEAITNAVKYAFAPGRQGTITVLLYQNDRFQGDGYQADGKQDRSNSPEIFLKIADNGGGLPDNFDIAGSNSLGMQLMKLFAEQLDGDLHFRNKEGVEITLVFRQQQPLDKASSFIYLGEETAN